MPGRSQPRSRSAVDAEDDAGAVFATRCRGRRRPARRRALDDPSPTFARAGRASRRTPRRSTRTTAVSTSTGLRAELVDQRARALAAHRRTRGAPRARRHDLARRASPTTVRFEPRRGAARRGPPDDVRGMASRPATVSPARVAAFDVLVRVFEDGAYADRALRTAGCRPRRARPGARPAARVRRGPARPDARPRDRDARPSTRQPPRPAGASCASSRRLPARVRRRRRRGTRRSTSRSSSSAAPGLERAVAFTNAVLRRLADGIASAARRPSPKRRRRGGAEALVPGLDRRDLVARPRRRRARSTLMRALNEPGHAVVRLVRGEIDGTPDADVPGAWHVERIDEAALAEGRIWPQSAASQLVGLAVGARAGRADARSLRCSRRQGDDARRRGDRGRDERGARARARGDRAPARRVGNVRVVVADGRALPPELTGFDRALVDAPCSGLGVLNRRPDLRWRAEPLPELQLELLRAAAERVRPGGTIVYSVCTINADESEAVVDAVRARDRSDARGRVAAVPASAPPRVPADASARPRHGRDSSSRGLRRALRIRCAACDLSADQPRPLVPRPREGVRDAPAARALAVETELGEGVEPATDRPSRSRRSEGARSPRARARRRAASGR